MAMLAERKRRQKLCLNPRGNDWRNDQTKFGQRLLEKMGWSAGQGLGAKNQGLTEIIRVRKKDDNKGLGFKDSGEEWLKTTNDYNTLLDQLRNSEETVADSAVVPSSLEDRSKKSKARVHYPKFTRGKDISRYSEKDLASIIGPDIVKPKVVDNTNTDYNTNQINKGSLTEYFKGKANCCYMSEAIDDKITINSEDQTSLSNKKHKKRKRLQDDATAFCSESNVIKTSNNNKQIEEETPNNKCVDNRQQKFSKKEQKIVFKVAKDKQTNLETCSDKNHLGNIYQKDKHRNDTMLPKKKKKMKNTESEAYQNEHVHNIDNSNNIQSNCEEEATNSKSNLESNKVSKKKKKKRNKELDSDVFNSSNIEENFVEGIDKVDASNLKTSKKKKTTFKIDSDVSVKSGDTDLIEGSLSTKVKPENIVKKKKRTLEQCDIKDLEAIDNDVCGRKNSKKINLENKGTNENMTVISELYGLSKKIDKGKKKEKTCIINEENDPQDEVSSTLVSEDNFSKQPNYFLTVNGRKTCLRRLNVFPKSENCTTVETQDFMAFNEDRNILPVGMDSSESKWGNKILKNNLPYIYVLPSEEDHNTPASVATFEYRQLLHKCKELNIPTETVKVVIKDSLTYSMKFRNKVKLMYKSKYFKSLLPSSEVTNVEKSVAKFASKIQPKVEMFNNIVELENKISEVAKNNDDIDKNKVILKEMKKQLNLIKECKTEDVSSPAEDVGAKSETVTTPHRGESNKPVSNISIHMYSPQLGSLQARIEEKLQILSEQMKMLRSGKSVLIEKKASRDSRLAKPLAAFRDCSFRRGRSGRRMGPVIHDRTLHKSPEDARKSQYSQPKNFSQGTSSRGTSNRSSWGTGYGIGFGMRRQSRSAIGFGRGRVIKVEARGRISQNNFDAKMYAEKCKLMDKIPELSFKGADLKEISGYAAHQNEACVPVSQPCNAPST